MKILVNLFDAITGRGAKKREAAREQLIRDLAYEHGDCYGTKTPRGWHDSGEEGAAFYRRHRDICDELREYDSVCDTRAAEVAHIAEDGPDWANFHRYAIERIEEAGGALAYIYNH